MQNTEDCESSWSGADETAALNLLQRDGLRALSSCAASAIVAVTRRAVAQEKQSASEAGCDACLAKPFSLQSFADVMSRRKQNPRS
jgi:CheY-like chemotaxis protein